MSGFLTYVSRLFKPASPEEKKLILAVKAITGKAPRNLRLYALATLHASSSAADDRGYRPSNERLEYLGDAILGAVVAEYLFKKYPFKDEGFLTEIRSRMVNRQTLNDLGRKLGLNVVVRVDSSRRGMHSHKSLYGDALEALVGAVYLDRGYKACRSFVIKKLIEPNFNIDELIKTNTNYKSQLIEWSQKHGKEVRFKAKELQHRGKVKEFEITIILDGEVSAKGRGLNKKTAEQAASRKVLESLQQQDADKP